MNIKGGPSGIVHNKKKKQQHNLSLENNLFPKIFFKKCQKQHRNIVPRLYTVIKVYCVPQLSSSLRKVRGKVLQIQ